MGKRSNTKEGTYQAFERKSRDFYGTVDPDAVKPLLPFITGKTFAEPCYGQGNLVELLEQEGILTFFCSDIEPHEDLDRCIPAQELLDDHVRDCDLIITNPPFSWPLLKPLLDHLPTLKPTWLLLPADVIHNKRMAPYMEKCSYIVSVGRLWWQPNKIKGVDNYVWLLLDYNSIGMYTIFHGRT